MSPTQEKEGISFSIIIKNKVTLLRNLFSTHTHAHTKYNLKNNTVNSPSILEYYNTDKNCDCLGKIRGYKLHKLSSDNPLDRTQYLYT